jgi:hypothetical protein
MRVEVLGAVQIAAAQQPAPPTSANSMGQSHHKFPNNIPIDGSTLSYCVATNAADIDAHK